MSKVHEKHRWRLKEIILALMSPLSSRKNEGLGGLRKIFLKPKWPLLSLRKQVWSQNDPLQVLQNKYRSQIDHFQISGDKFEAWTTPSSHLLTDALLDVFRSNPWKLFPNQRRQNIKDTEKNNFTTHETRTKKFDNSNRLHPPTPVLHPSYTR